MIGSIEGALTLAGVLALGILVVGVCAQGRLRHVILWIFGAVPRRLPGITFTVPRQEQSWSVIARLADAPTRETVDDRS